jgi:hypothetical protein
VVYKVICATVGRNVLIFGEHAFTPALHLLYTCFTPALHLLYTWFGAQSMRSVAWGGGVRCFLRLWGCKNT